MSEVRLQSLSLHCCVVFLLATGLVGCGSRESSVYSPNHNPSYEGGKVDPVTADEKRVLEMMEGLAPGKPEKAGELVVVADEPYDSASGRQCRRVTLKQETGGEQFRLVCKDGAAWFYAPSIFFAGEGR